MRSLKSLDALLRELKPPKGVKNVVLVRCAQSMGSHGGSLIGWTDSRLTVKGREQANKLYRELYSHIDNFAGIYSSNLSRAYDTAEIALGFPSQGTICNDKNLRQINFGEEEGIHFDSLPSAEKERINSKTYKAHGGQSWSDVDQRMAKFYSTLSPGISLAFSHGGAICTQTMSKGIEDILPHCSAVALELDQEHHPQKVLFSWSPSMVEEI